MRKGNCILIDFSFLYHLINKNLLLNRNSMNKTCATLKSLIEELIKYFVICEEEVNNTLITEVLKRQLSDSLSNEKTQKLDELDASKKSLESDTLNSSATRIQRVHFAPQSTGIVSIINSNFETLPTILEEDEDITEKLKQELNNCVRRLKSESAEILGISLATTEGQRGSLSKDTWMDKVNEELNLKLRQAEALIMGYQEEAEQLKVTIIDLQRKLINAESKKEIITEGYGENDEIGTDITFEDFSQLHEKGTRDELHFGINFVCNYNS